ncbi:hypothetical protein [Bifidobacterium sp. ESL0790]|uniref:hypothetical protein n=1 Tax=Bifidobacterium sp. ESL0790 TaxID=2983233 RepID=UPI0023F89CD0|nr:hypothetical protein [Bifidobacterium sp. ESL0790]WEV72282.1 hypothetical protein OZY47_07610 [Bifidobacterium sp. ESL0790]
MANTSPSNPEDLQPTKEYQAADQETIAVDSAAVWQEGQAAAGAPTNQPYSGQPYGNPQGGSRRYAGQPYASEQFAGQQYGNDGGSSADTTGGSSKDGDFQLGGYVPPVDISAKNHGRAKFWAITAVIALVCGLAGGAISGFGAASMATPSHHNERSQTSGRAGEGMGEPMGGEGMPGSGSQPGGSGSRKSGGSQSQRGGNDSQSGGSDSQSGGDAQGLDSQGGSGSGSGNSDGSSNGNSSSSSSSSSTRAGVGTSLDSI